MLLTIFLAIVFCGAATLFLVSAVAFAEFEQLFSSAPKEVQGLIKPREHELFYGSKTMGRALIVLSVVIILGVGVIAIWDGIRNDFTFWQFFTRFVLIFTIYKMYDMVAFDYFLLLKSRFFQYFYPEVGDASMPKKYGFNIKSQLLKLFVIFPASSALAAWICTLVS